ncbi:MAG: ATP-binding cassette domain-containing protein [Desulfurococcales archaeon]|nr:ATP-binding cassette domain-containing protein [Desulfurococcales archaeon]
MVEPLVTVEGLRKYFPVKKGFFKKPDWIRAVDDVTFQVFKGETLGIVGESGSGKTTLAKLILRLIDPTTGKIYFDGTDIVGVSKKELRKYRRRMGIVFQDPSASLNPRMSIEETLRRPLIVHGIKDREEVRRRVLDILQKVGLGKEHMKKYPHQLSGGQQQRVAIARAIILNPDLVVLDEPTSSLDVSIQAQILNLLVKLQHDLNLTYIFISHDLLTVRYVSDRIAVMYLGKLVEIAEADELFYNAKHPYTATLLSAAPIPNPEVRYVKRFSLVRGEPPSPINPPPGCRFHPRCPYAISRCRTKEPVLKDVGGGHYVACHRAEELDLSEYTSGLWKIITESRVS